jgi:hypothetical protein
MTKPIPARAEVAVEYPDKLYLGTFEHTARYEARFDDAGISLHFDQAGTAETRKSVRLHLHYALFAEVLRDLAATANAIPSEDRHRQMLQEAASAFALAMRSKDHALVGGDAD